MAPKIHSTELEQQIERARAPRRRCSGSRRSAKLPPRLYMNETGSSWRPAGGSRLNHGAGLTSAVVEGRDFLRARSESRRRAAMPEGTPVLFAGGRLSFATAEEAKALADSVWETLDKVRERVADMVLVHGGDSKGVDRLAAAWAERRKVAAGRLRSRPPARRARRIPAQRADALAEAALSRRLCRQRRARAAGHPGQGEGRACRRSARPLGTNPKRAALG